MLQAHRIPQPCAIGLCRPIGSTSPLRVHGPQATHRGWQSQRKPVVAHYREGEETAKGEALQSESVDSSSLSPEFKRARWITFASLWVGYAAFYVTRNAFNFVNPMMLNDASLGLNLALVGTLTSFLPIAYAFSKGMSGFLGSTTSPRLLLSGGLAATGLMCLMFGFGNAYLWFAVFWGCNGLLQGLGAPACARLLTQWYSSSERGTFWSIWTASNNVGGFLAPLVAGTAASALGWRFGMWIPAAAALAIASVIFFTIKDSPEDAGFDSLEAEKKPRAEKDAPASAGKPSAWDVLKADVLPNPFVWLFALSYFFVYLVRQGTSSWFVHYLMNVKGVSDLGTAAAQVSGLELGGFFGALSAGIISDALVRRAKRAGKTGLVGVRTRVVLAYTVATGAALWLFSICPNNPALQWAAVAAVGFCLYGPQMLIGLCGAEVVRPEAVGACQGLLGWISYLGATCAGAPLAYAVQKYGWEVFFTTLVAACGFSFVLLLPMANLQSYTQKAKIAGSAPAKSA